MDQASSDHAPQPQAVLDIEQGLARLMGNSRIYFNALRRFATHMDAAEGVAAQLASGDHAGASRAMHTLKGAAGLLGAGEVQALAGALESSIARGDKVDTLLGTLADALQRVQLHIDAAMRDHVETSATRTQVAPDLPALLDRLAVLLDEGNGAAIELLEEWEAVLREGLGGAAWQAVSSAAHAYDFERAGVALQQARLRDAG
ncbi:Hpt domain-containing protein [Pseudoduganella lurida]|uniref:Hpt domain-containing protein n=1 Tax=Pseudoduganella lurida TaxID=1036180 RepID=UPI0011A818B6|nr:Hpt domain-containing protein [Pseudoduganella lurida]